MTASAGVVRVQFMANDNLTQSMIVYGLKKDFTDILQAVQASGHPYSQVRVIGSFPLTDEYGNSEETQVASATFSKRAIDRINWASFNYDNIWAIASQSRVDPRFR